MKPLTEATIRQRLKKLHDRRLAEYRRHKAAMAVIDTEVLSLMDRCPHERTRVESVDYLPCVEVCNLCGAEIG